MTSLRLWQIGRNSRRVGDVTFEPALHQLRIRLQWLQRFSLLQCVSARIVLVRRVFPLSRLEVVDGVAVRLVVEFCSALEGDRRCLLTSLSHLTE